MKVMISILFICSYLSSATNVNLKFKDCKDCHSENFNKSAFGISKNVATMSHKDIISALYGYKNRTYGGDYKSVMESVVDNYNYDELSTIFIEKLEKRSNLQQRANHRVTLGCQNLIDNNTDTRNYNITIGYIIGYKNGFVGQMNLLGMKSSENIKDFEQICSNYLDTYNKGVYLRYAPNIILEHFVKINILKENGYEYKDFQNLKEKKLLSK